MPPRLIRITFDRTTFGFNIEYGEEIPPGLVGVEVEEFEKLGQELKEFSDFATAEELGNEKRQELMAKKKRYEELNQRDQEGGIGWFPVDPLNVESILFVSCPGEMNTYVENLPTKWIDKLFESTLSLNVPFRAMVSSPKDAGLHFQETFEEHEPEEVDDPGDLISYSRKQQTVLEKIVPLFQREVPHWREVLEITESDEGIKIQPKKFLKDDWKFINTAIKDSYGDDCWRSYGKGDKTAHWLVKL